MAKVYAPYAHNKVQLGRESTPGTAVPATVIWRGESAQIEDTREIVFVEEQVGVLVGAERSYTSGFGGQLVLPATPMTFEQLPHILEAAIKTATPSGSAPSYTRMYDMPTGNNLNTIKTYTLESYNVSAPADFREMPYSFVSEFSLEAAAGEAWMMSATWQGRSVNTGTPTSLSTLLDVEEALLGRTKLYIDDSGDTIGTTQLLGVLMGASVNLTTGIVPVPVGDGTLQYSGTKFVRPEGTFSITIELEQDGSTSTAAVERLAAEAGDVRLIRLEIDGESTSNVTIDLAGVYNFPIPSYENANGNATLTFSGRIVYSPADALYLDIEVTNGLATL